MPRSRADGKAWVARGKAVLEQEAAAVSALAKRLDKRFSDAVELLAKSKGRLVAAGVGESGATARKSAATLTSSGPPAPFLPPVDSGHGALGIVGRRDA